MPERRPGSDGEHALQQRLGTTERADRFYGDQVLDHLNERMREFVARQEMFFLATADRRGECDSTFRAGPPGFLRVFDDRTLGYPEYRGNGVLASLGNIEENPHVGILLIDFLRDRIGLHLNGRARVVEDAEMRAARPGLPVDPVPGRRAVVWVEVTVEEAYIHCAKHIPHLAKVPAQPRRAAAGESAPARAWGTDDVRRKGGDFFGAAAEARQRGPRRLVARDHREPYQGEPSDRGNSNGDGPYGRGDGDGPCDCARSGRASSDPERRTGQDRELWRQEAERALARARQPDAEREREPFRGWFG
ncbi:hypothetical protein ACZ90_23485 [Streptomyces albus subsp. albus]|nr:hypothetical protein ACZ90_23485 [Streptomyces albus subsp. albus]